MSLIRVFLLIFPLIFFACASNIKPITFDAPMSGTYKVPIDSVRTFELFQQRFWKAESKMKNPVFLIPFDVRKGRFTNSEKASFYVPLRAEAYADTQWTRCYPLKSCYWVYSMESDSVVRRRLRSDLGSKKSPSINIMMELDQLLTSIERLMGLIIKEYDFIHRKKREAQPLNITLFEIESLPDLSRVY
ncbi:hypothetical protein FUAX_09220 [Fulvitalea axinellae]|uniref:DUF4136 domain-containing protein n=1 Tax=Fulvitalea axinellae TaxID=1182444 RepID=A0AAU9D8B4_9BACT|nr:hypothetical protein FUAX_09220 [Fulvitalea axinellae]